jgi:hypothetical protein
MSTQAYHEQTERRRRLFAPRNAVIDVPIDLRNGRPGAAPRPLVVASPAEPTIVRPQVVDSHETVLNTARHVGLACLRGRRAVSLDTADRTLISVGSILNEASEYFGVTVQDIISLRRTRNVVRPRMVVAYLARHMTTMTLPGIAKRLGNRDHTTILSACKTIERDIAKDEDFAKRVRELRLRVLQAAEA